MIDIRALSLTYPAAGRGAPVHALRDIDLHVRAGEIFGIIGRSGAGKSSLVRCINLLNRPSSGQVLVDGRDLLRLDSAALRAARRNIGMVFQHFNLLAARTVFDNVALPLELAGCTRAQIAARVQPLLELVGLAPLATRYPAQISGGQKQRVGIARALASQPRVLLCDEATSALDPHTTRAILDLLRQVQRELGLTVVLITHQMQVIKHIAARVAVMEAGSVVECGAVLDVFTRAVHPATRSLIDEIVPRQLPAAALAQARQLARQVPAGQNGQLLRVSWVAGYGAQDGVLEYLMRSTGVHVNLLHGQIDEVGGQVFGALALYLHGEAAQLHAARTWLDARAAQVQAIQYDELIADGTIEKLI